MKPRMASPAISTRSGRAAETIDARGKNGGRTTGQDEAHARHFQKVQERRSQENGGGHECQRPQSARAPRPVNEAKQGGQQLGECVCQAAPRRARAFRANTAQNIRRNWTARRRESSPAEYPDGHQGKVQRAPSCRKPRGPRQWPGTADRRPAPAARQRHREHVFGGTLRGGKGVGAVLPADPLGRQPASRSFWSKAIGSAEADGPASRANLRAGSSPRCARSTESCTAVEVQSAPRSSAPEEDERRQKEDGGNGRLLHGTLLRHSIERFAVI